ncbi:MAG: hypothetical protein JWP59_3641 [Massilia sp.]|nr:hypothetical protein [Massilia sp.]
MKNLKQYLAALLAIAALAAPLAGRAQNPGNGGTTFSGLPGAARPEEFLGKFVELSNAEAAANTTLSNALGIAAPARPALDMSALAADIANAATAADAARQRLMQAVSAPVALNDGAKADFAAGALALMQATRDFTALTKNLGAIKQSLAMSGAKARVALYASRNTADIAEKLRAELKAVVAFAAANQITLAPEVTATAAQL